jgi:uncharacterized repeat protein (TIGR01451 family)
VSFSLPTLRSVVWPGVVVVALGLARVALVSADGPVMRPAAAVPAGSLAGEARTRALQAIGGVPLHFERNLGQADTRFDFVATGAGYRVGLGAGGATVALTDGSHSTGVFRFELEGARRDVPGIPLDTLPGKVSYYRGNDPAQWQEAASTHSRVRYAGVFDGIDVVYYGNQKRLQYDFIVAPGADPAAIAFRVDGAERVSVAADGRLLVTLGDRVLAQERPFTYQVVDGVRQEVASRFVLDGTIVRFAVGSYDARRPLVIDPVIAYASWFGAGGEEGVLDLAVDTDGGIVVYGYSHDAQGLLTFPTTPGVAKASRGNDHDAFVTKFNAAGTAIVFSTLLGGSGDENFNISYTGGMALDAAGNVHVTGTTRSNDFPTTPGAFDTTRNNPGALSSDDGFYAKVSPSGGLLYGTYLGGNAIDIPGGLDIDAAGNVYIVGRTGSIPGGDPASGGFTLVGSSYDTSFNGTYDLFLLRFNSTGTLTYSTYIGGSGGDGTTTADVKASRTTANVVYIVSDTSNASFPTTAGTRYQGFVGGGTDGVLLRMNLSLAPANQLTYGTFFGGDGVETLAAVALDATDAVYVAGSTNSSQATLGAVPTWSGSIGPSGTDVFVARFDTSQSGAASLLYGMRLNGFYTDEADDIAVDSQGQAWVTVSSGSLAPTPDPTRDFPLKNSLSIGRAGNYQHPVVFQVNAAGNDVLLSSLIGGDSAGAPHVALAINASGEVWVGSSSSGDINNSYDYLGVVGPYDGTYNGGDSDVTLERIGQRADLSITKASDKPYPQYTVLAGESVIYTITLSNPTGDTARNITVTDNLPSEVVFVSCATSIGTCGGSGNARTVFIPALPTGQTATITLATVAAPHVTAGMIWYNTANFTTDTTDPNPGNNTGGGAGSPADGGTPTTANDPDGDADGDGLVNLFEDAFGLNSVNNTSDNGANGDPDGDGKTNLQEQDDLTHPRGTDVVYLAEGANNTTFDTQLALANPTDTTARVLTSYQKGDGTEVKTYEQIAPLTRKTVNLKSIQGLGSAEFSTLVEADTGLVADRTMTWGEGGYGSHAERGIGTRNQTKWYFAEGATFGPFNLFYLIQNPTTQDATVRVTYLLPAPAAPLVKTYTVTKQSRFNIWVDNEGIVDPALAALASTDVSAIIESTNGVPIIAERAMYLDQPGQAFGAGHESAGVNAPGTQWFLAEGATGDYFDLFILIANPNPTPAAVTADYLLTTGQIVTRTYTVPGNSRFNIWVDQEPGLSNVAVSTRITSTNGVPIIVERSMWWPGPTSATWQEAHNSPGETTTGTKWAFAEGEVGGPRDIETYVLIANTSPFPATVRATVMFEDGTAAISRNFQFKATSRDSIVPAVHFPETLNKKFGMVIESIGATPAQIVVERAMYSDANGVNWAAGTNALATKLQ